MLHTRERLESFYKYENGCYLIEMKYSNLKNIFNTIDPAPILDKDLNDTASEYIISSVQEIGIRQPVKIIIYLPGKIDIRKWSKILTLAFNNFFEYKSQNEKQKLRFMFKDGRISFVIGIFFLVFCIIAGNFVPEYDIGALGNLLKEGLLIGGWVAMWKPVQLLLYDWWPILRTYRINKKLAATPVEIRKTKT